MSDQVGRMTGCIKRLFWLLCEYTCPLLPFTHRFEGGMVDGKVSFSNYLGISDDVGLRGSQPIQGAGPVE